MQKRRLTNWRKIQWQGMKARTHHTVGTHYANEMAAAWGHSLWGETAGPTQRHNLSWDSAITAESPKREGQRASSSFGLGEFGKSSSAMYLFTIFLFVFSVGLSLGIVLLLLN